MGKSFAAAGQAHRSVELAVGCNRGPSTGRQVGDGPQVTGRRTGRRLRAGGDGPQVAVDGPASMGYRHQLDNTLSCRVSTHRTDNVLSNIARHTHARGPPATGASRCAPSARRHRRITTRIELAWRTDDSSQPGPVGDIDASPHALSSLGEPTTHHNQTLSATPTHHHTHRARSAAAVDFLFSGRAPSVSASQLDAGKAGVLTRSPNPY